jgi:serine protease Do
VNGATDLTSKIVSLSPGDVATLDILRDGKPLTLKVTLGQRPENLAEQGGQSSGKAPEKSALRGVTVQNLTADIRNQLGVSPETQGVVVSQVDPDSPAAEALQRGDVIESINRQPVHNVDDFNRLAGQAAGQTLLRINRQGQGIYVVISPEGGE